MQYLPAQGTAGALVSIAQFAGHKLSKRRDVNRKRELRESLIALNAFIGSMKRSNKQSDLLVCLQDALRERRMVITQLAVLSGEGSAKPHQRALRSRAQRLFLLYMPSRPLAWLLHWAFFTLLIMTVVGTVRGLLHNAYLPVPLLVPFLMATSSLAVVVRLVVSYTECEGRELTFPND